MSSHHIIASLSACYPVQSSGFGAKECFASPRLRDSPSHSVQVAEHSLETSHKEAFESADY